MTVPPLFFVYFYVFTFVCGTYGQFSDHFKEFIIKNRGAEVEELLSRRDLGTNFCFGGKNNDSEISTKRPVIFVHGLTGSAADVRTVRDYFGGHGYSSGELFATTYGQAGAVPGSDVFVNCTFFKQVRMLIEVVSAYSSGKVDVLGYSLGALVSRKAILGGKCFDNEQNLGDPLTEMVETFIGCGGVCYGLEGCSSENTSGWFHKDQNVCNPISSMRCDSKLLLDMNSKETRFEGTSSYSLYSDDDSVLGTNCCGHHCGKLANANETFSFPKRDHHGVMYGTAEKQYELLSIVKKATTNLNASESNPQKEMQAAGSIPMKSSKGDIVTLYAVGFAFTLATICLIIFVFHKTYKRDFRYHSLPTIPIEQ